MCFVAQRFSLCTTTLQVLLKVLYLHTVSVHTGAQEPSVALSAIVCELRSVHIVIPGFSHSELDCIIRNI